MIQVQIFAIDATEPSALSDWNNLSATTSSNCCTSVITDPVATSLPAVTTAIAQPNSAFARKTVDYWSHNIREVANLLLWVLLAPKKFIARQELAQMASVMVSRRFPVVRTHLSAPVDCFVASIVFVLPKMDLVVKRAR